MHEPKKRLYRESKNSLAESLTNFTQSRFLRTKTSFARAFLRCPQKIPIFTNQKVFVYRKLYALLSKASRFRNPNTARSNHFLLSAKAAFFTYKSLSFAQTFPCRFQKPPIFTNQKPFFRTNLFLLLSKATLFHPPPPFLTTLNLLSAKNTAVLLISALTPYAVKPEPRTDSNHCRRYPVKLQLFAKPVTL